MARTYVQPGDVIDVTAPAGGVVSGEPLLIASLFGIPQVTAPEGTSFAFMVGRVHSLPKANVQLSEGQSVAWDCAAGNVAVPGVCKVSEAAAATKCLIRLSGIPTEAA